MDHFDTLRSVASRPNSTTKFVLLATPLTNASAEATRRAEAISRGLGAELVSLRVLSASSHAHLRSAIGKPSSPESPADYSLSAASKGQWLLTRQGDFLAVVAETARALTPVFVLFPDVCGLEASSVCDLVVECRAPVLLAREASVSSAVVAATDLEKPTFPVLRAGALLSSSLGARTVFLHNLAPDSPARRSEPLAPKKPRPSVGSRLDDLSAIASSLRVESENIVTTQASPAEALLSFVHRERPDVVIVGAREHERRYLGSAPVAEALIEAFSGNVLLVPVSGAMGEERATPYGVS
jgi:nucleotide-binding universal stress UspA family protein